MTQFRIMNNLRPQKMKNLLSVFGGIFFTIISIVLISCSDGNNNKGILGNLPEVFEECYAENNKLKEKAQEIKTQEEKAALIKESKEQGEKWRVKMETTSKALDGSELNIKDGDISVSKPVVITFNGFVSKRKLMPKFKLTGDASAAVDIFPKVPLLSTYYNVYLVGYDEEGNELFSTRVGTIDGQKLPDTDKGEIKAGTPVKFDNLLFSSKDCEGYKNVTKLMLETK